LAEKKVIIVEKIAMIVEKIVLNKLIKNKKPIHLLKILILINKVKKLKIKIK
jgi:hypothetical protein